MARSRSSGKKTVTHSPAQLRAFRKRFRDVPFLQLLKMRVDEIGSGTVTVSMPIRPQIRQYLGVAHGGALSALADTAATFACLTILPLGTEVVTIEFKLNFLEPVVQRRAIAAARVVRMGGRTAVVEATVTESGSRKPACVGLFTMAVLRPKNEDR
ncbi:MAG: PaaI family thioesterase [Candidatus Zixiibacteriota bacterium]